MKTDRSVFISHSRHDKSLLPWFGDVFKSVSVAAFTAEVEKPHQPQKAILNAIKNCEAVFVLLSPETLGSKYTHSWIASETSLAYALGKPTFVFVERNVDVPFPLPYFCAYTILWLGEEDHEKAIREMVRKSSYQDELDAAWSIHCPYPDCQAESKSLNSPLTFITKCPTCLTPIEHYGGKQYLLGKSPK